MAEKKKTVSLDSVNRRIDEIEASKAAARGKYEKSIAEAREVIARLDSGSDSLLDADVAIAADKERRDAEAKVAFCEGQLEKIANDPCIEEGEYNGLEQVFKEYREAARDEYRAAIKEPMRMLAEARDAYQATMAEADNTVRRINSVTNAGKELGKRHERSWTRGLPIHGKEFYLSGVSLAVNGPERDSLNHPKVNPECLGAWRAVTVMRDPAPTIGAFE